MNKIRELSEARDYWKWVLDTRWAWFVRLLSAKADAEALNNMIQGIRDAEMMIWILSDEIIDWHSEHCISPEVIEL